MSYSNHQAEANFREWDKEHKRRRMEHWHRLRRAKEDYYGVYDRLTESTADFYYHLQQQYGIKLDLDASGNITDTYQIINEKKYMIFLLKYPI